MKLIRQSMAIGLAVAVSVVAACSTAPKPSGSVSSGGPGSPANPGDDTTGNISGQLTLLGGEHISLVKYTLSNQTWTGISPTATAAASPSTLTGQYNISGTTTLSFVIGSVPAGAGYALEISATSDDGTVHCSYPSDGIALPSGGQGLGPQNIQIVNRQTTVDNINLQCVNAQGLDSGSLLINAIESNCPVWNTIVANPYNITLDAGVNVSGSNGPGSAGANAFYDAGAPVTAQLNDGQQLVLVGSATGPNPANLVFNWSSTPETGAVVATIDGTATSMGTKDPNSSGASATNKAIFTCPAAPTPTTTFDVALDLTDLPVPDGGTCDSRFTHGIVKVTCNNPAPCGGQPFSTVQTYASGLCTGNGNTSVNDPAGFPYVPGPADINVPTDFCCAGACGDGTINGKPATLATTFPSGTGGCTAPLVNNGAGCCVPLLPCTTAGQLNCVTSQGNDKPGPLAGGLCTPTEVKIVQKDIATGKSFAPGPGPTGSCYQCLYAGGCIDDTHFGDVGHECEDAFATFGTAAMCQATIDCIFTSKCAASAVATCYCGTAGVSTTCQGNPAAGPINGACAATIAAGLGFPLTDGTDNTAQLENVNRAAGKADQIFQCGLTNGCTACQL